MLRSIIILDFGSQYTQLIARRIREMNVFCEIERFNLSLKEIEKRRPYGIILSGGPSSIYEENAPDVETSLFEMGIPVLGICYGMQLISSKFGGKVLGGRKREYGRTVIKVLGDHALFRDFHVGGLETVWMSHGDHVEKLPEGFTCDAVTDSGVIASACNHQKKIYCLQFHPEVVHTVNGVKILRNFVFNICGAMPDWTISSFVERAVSRIREETRGSKVLCALSGGVDSSVSAVLCHRAIGDDLLCLFVDNGLLRKGEADEVLRIFRGQLSMPLLFVDASKRFYKALKDVVDPEEKRKRIGREFIAVFEDAVKELKGFDFLVQGTLYPDLIESRSYKGPSHTIKSHHNVGGLPEKMKFKVIEPLKELFKDEVRKVGQELGVPESIIRRQPFPGPGLAVRIIGEVTEERVRKLQQADWIVQDELKGEPYYTDIWQSFAVLLPVKTVGVMGDSRTYEEVIAIRAVSSSDGMTADVFDIPLQTLKRIANRIINETKGVNRVVYDISSKPPATIEWE